MESNLGLRARPVEVLQLKNRFEVFGNEDEEVFPEVSEILVERRERRKRFEKGLKQRWISFACAWL